MRGFFAVFRKEMAGFFVSPIAYAVISGFLLISGFIFWANVSYMSVVSLQAANNPFFAEKFNVNDYIVRPYLDNVGFILLFVMPLLTMRVFSEEKKTGSIELLLTYPISDWAVVLGKFGAIKMMILAILVSTVPSILLLFGITSPDIGSIITGYLGLILLGASLGALGIFISSLTENQIVAAAITFAAVLFFKILSWGAALADETVGSFLKHLSISEHLDSFNKGIISLPDLSYFILFTVFFLFMTLRSIETYRWRG